MSSPNITMFILISTFAIYLIRDGSSAMSCVFAPFCHADKKEQIMTELLPTWDANQTWLVFTLAGLYGGFPILFGSLLSNYYEFFGSFLMCLIVRGSSVEFYIKSVNNKAFWLNLLAFSSGLLILCHSMACYYILSSEVINQYKILSIASFIVCFNFTGAYCHLFKVQLWQRSGLVLSLIITSSLIFKVFDVDVSANTLNLSILLFRISLLTVFLIVALFKVPPAFLGKGLLYVLFFTNVFFVIDASIPTLFYLIPNQNMPLSSNNFFVINIYSLIFLPIIAAMLWRVQKIFYRG